MRLGSLPCLYPCIGLLTVFPSAFSSLRVLAKMQLSSAWLHNSKEPNRGLSVCRRFNRCGGGASVSIEFSSRLRKDQQVQKYHQSHYAENAPHGVQPAPACQQALSFDRPPFQRRAKQPLVGGQDHDQSEW